MNKSFKKIGFSLIAISTFATFTCSLPIGTRIACALAEPVGTIIAAAAFKVKLPPPPPNRGIAGNRVGGASRVSSRNPIDESPNSDRRLTALVPEYKSATGSGKSNPELTKVWGITANEHPTLWFYIPYAQNSISRIDFILIDGDNPTNKTVYQNAIQSPTQPGIVNFSLPQTSTPLAIDKLYQWELKLTMKRQLDKEISVKGWIQRADLNSDLSDRIKQSTPDRQAALYAENGFWYDALSMLAELRRDHWRSISAQADAPPTERESQDLAIIQDWKNILKSVDLGKLANKPFVK
jgi:hypothetical protein